MSELCGQSLGDKVCGRAKNHPGAHEHRNPGGTKLVWLDGLTDDGRSDGAYVTTWKNRYEESRLSYERRKIRESEIAIMAKRGALRDDGMTASPLVASLEAAERYKDAQEALAAAEEEAIAADEELVASRTGGKPRPRQRETLGFITLREAHASSRRPPSIDRMFEPKCVEFPEDPAVENGGVDSTSESDS